MEVSLSLSAFSKMDTQALFIFLYLSPSLAYVKWPWKRFTSKMAAKFEGPKIFFYQLQQTWRLAGYMEDRKVKLNDKSLMKTFDSSVCKSIQISSLPVAAALCLAKLALYKM